MTRWVMNLMWSAAAVFLFASAAFAGESLKLVQTVPLPELRGSFNHHAADAKGHRFFITAPGEKKVVVVDLRAGKAIRVLSDVPASAACFIPDADILCLSGAGGVWFYNGSTFAAIGKVDLQSAVDELQYDAREKRLYAGVMDADKAGIAVIDVPGRRLVHVLNLPAKPQGFVVEQGGGRIYANTPLAGGVTVLDGRARSVAAIWKLTEAQSNYPIALDERNHRLFVGCRRPARLLVLDSSSGKPVSSVETGGDADDMSFDAEGKRIYLACGTGVVTTVQQLDADHYRKLADTPTAQGARNSLFVAEFKAFYVTVPPEAQRPAQLRAYVRDE